MVRLSATEEAKEDVFIWMAALLSTACDQHMGDHPKSKGRVYQLTVSRLHDSIKHLANSENPPPEIRRIDPEGKLFWLTEAISEAQKLGVSTDGPENEFVTITLDSARETIKWVFRRKGKDYLDNVEKQADAVSTLLKPPQTILPACLTP